MSLNVATILRESVAQHPDKPCLLVDGISVTYADVDRGSARAAAGLLKLGLVRGDVVAVQLENSADFVFCYFGILRAGLTMVPLNPLLREPEVRHVMNDSGAMALLTSSSRVDEVARAAGDVPVFVRGSGELSRGVTPSPASTPTGRSTMSLRPARRTPQCSSTPAARRGGPRGLSSPTCSS